MYLPTILLLAVWASASPPPVQWGGPYSGADETRLELIEDAETLARVWNRIHGGTDTGRPFVDFDRYRMVLTLRGRAMDLQRVVATSVETNENELVLTIDATPIRTTDVPGPGETTAWGLFMVPRTPERIRVGYEQVSEEGGETKWKTITVLIPGS